MRLVLDWDGTVTERDTLHMVIERFGDLDVFRDMESELGRRLTLNEVIAVEMATITAPRDEVVAWLLAHARVRPGFAALAARHDPLVVSAGFHELIEPVLDREGVSVAVIANRIAAHPDGWRATFRERGLCDVCGEPCKRLDVGGQRDHSSTSATACPIGASRSPARASSPVTGSPTGSTPVARRTSATAT